MHAYLYVCMYVSNYLSIKSIIYLSIYFLFYFDRIRRLTENLGLHDDVGLTSNRFARMSQIKDSLDRRTQLGREIYGGHGKQDGNVGLLQRLDFIHEPHPGGDWNKSRLQASGRTALFSRPSWSAFFGNTIKVIYAREPSISGCRPHSQHR